MQTTRSATIRYHGEKCRCRSSETKVSRAQMRFKSNKVSNERRSWISATCFMLIHQEVRLMVQQERSVGFILWGSWTETQIPFESIRLLLSYFFTHRLLCSLAGNKEPEYTTRVQSVHSAFLLSQQETPFYAAADRKQSTYLWTCREWSTASPWREFV